MNKERNLSYFFNPRSIAVIGASRDAHKLGHGVVRNLHDYHFRGKVYPVNPRVQEVLGYPCYPSIADVPGPVDLAVIVVPAQIVHSMLEECGEAGAGRGVVNFTEKLRQGTAQAKPSRFAKQQPSGEPQLLGEVKQRRSAGSPEPVFQSLAEGFQCLQ